MSRSRPDLHSLVSARTLFVAISGFGAAALVTSLSVLLVDDPDSAIRIAVLGGTSVLGTSSFVVALCSAMLPSGDDRLTWALVASALALTTLGSGLRASSFQSDWSGLPPEVGEATYAMGLFVLMAAMVLWPILRRRGASLTPSLGAALGFTGVATAVFWFVRGAELARTSLSGGPIDPVRLRQMLGLIALLTLVAAFAAACAFVLRSEQRSASQALMAVALLAVVAGDIYWLTRVVGPGWIPGAFGDFVHLAGHVLIAVAASLALDIGRAERGATR